MAVKKPLVLASGQIQELQSGDEINIDASDITTGTIATARLATSGTASASTFLRGDQTWATPTGGGAGGGMTVTIFTSSGTFTNPQTGILRFTVIGGGGGGGAGRRGAASTLRLGGGGGGGGAWAVSTFMAAELPASIPIWVGANGVGGANNTTNDSNGAAGTSGGNSMVGGTASITTSTILYGYGGVGAPGGTNVNDGSGQTRDSIYESLFLIGGNSFNQMVTANTFSPNGTPKNVTLSMTTRGAFGGGISAGNVISGAEGSFRQVGHVFNDPIWITNSVPQPPTYSNGGAGSHLFNKRGIFISTGGGGGSAGEPHLGGAGGLASGGGGGAAETNGGTYNNAGGNGGGGIIIVQHWP